MIAPWTVEAVQAVLAQRTSDRRLLAALAALGALEPDCSQCSGRPTVSDCPDCGLDIPPYRDVFATRGRTIWDRPDDATSLFHVKQ